MPFFVSTYPRIGERVIMVNGKDQTVRINIYRVNIIFIRIYLIDTTMRRSVLKPQFIGIIGMYGLISDGVAIQALHDIYLTSIGPFCIFGQHPDSGPCTASSLQLGFYLYPSTGKKLFTFGINATGKIGCGIILLRIIHNAAQDHISISHGIA